MSGGRYGNWSQSSVVESERYRELMRAEDKVQTRAEQDAMEPRLVLPDPKEQALRPRPRTPPPSLPASPPAMSPPPDRPALGLQRFRQAPVLSVRRQSDALVNSMGRSSSSLSLFADGPASMHWKAPSRKPARPASATTALGMSDRSLSMGSFTPMGFGSSHPPRIVSRVPLTRASRLVRPKPLLAMHVPMHHQLAPTMTTIRPVVSRPASSHHHFPQLGGARPVWSTMLVSADGRRSPYMLS